MKKVKLNLGCGRDKKKDYINLDSSKNVRPDKVWNLEKTPLHLKIILLTRLLLSTY